MVAKQTRLNLRTEDSQIIGFRVPRALARDIKAEAAKRGLKLNSLLVEMWYIYKKNKKK